MSGPPQGWAEVSYEQCWVPVSRHLLGVKMSEGHSRCGGKWAKYELDSWSLECLHMCWGCCLINYYASLTTLPSRASSL